MARLQGKKKKLAEGNIELTPHKELRRGLDGVPLPHSVVGYSRRPLVAEGHQAGVLGGGVVSGGG